MLHGRKLFWLLPFLVCGRAHAYDLFHPVPRNEMRELDSDRPGFTDSPHTVDAGHLQLESGLFGYTLTRSPGKEIEAYQLNSLSVGAGLTDFIEAQASLDTYGWQTTRQAGLPDDKSASVGDLILRAKFAVVGNQGGRLAAGVIPKVKVPAAADGNHKMEEGLNVPLVFGFGPDYSLGLMPEWDHRLDADGEAFHEEFLAAAILSGKVAGALGAYVQYETISSTESAVPRNAAAGFGFLYALGPDAQLDAGLDFGLTAGAADRNFAFGLVLRY